MGLRVYIVITGRSHRGNTREMLGMVNSQCGAKSYVRWRFGRHYGEFIRSLSEAAAKGVSVVKVERSFTNALMVLGVGSKIMFYIVANFSATIKAKWVSLEWSFAG